MRKGYMLAALAVVVGVSLGFVGCGGDDDEATPVALAHPYPVGTRVQAIVQGPSGSTCINVGDLGILFCYDASDPNLPYLVNWDRACGFSQSQVCGVTAPNGWWVGFGDVTAVVVASAGPEFDPALATTEDTSPKNLQ